MTSFMDTRSHCPITFALDSFGDKWSLIIIRDILFRQKRFFKEFSESEENIASNILSNRLEKLENEGIISKTSDSTNLKRYIYRPTEKCLGLLPMLVEMIKWSLLFDKEAQGPKEILDQIKNNPEKFIQSIRERFIEK